VRLYVSPMSPYVRKVRAVAVHLGLLERIEVVLCKVRAKTKGLEDFNPLGRVPTLVLDNGQALFDSPVICEYLDSLHSGEKLIPLTGERRWQVLRQQALGDGIMDAATPWREETHRPKEQQSLDWLHIYRGMVGRAADFLEKEVEQFNRVSVGTLSIGCALGYLDFRFSEENWRLNHPRLSEWFKQFEKLDAMKETKPYQINPEDL
jgi:glutathione S-transferase